MEAPALVGPSAALPLARGARPFARSDEHLARLDGEFAAAAAAAAVGSNPLAQATVTATAAASTGAYDFGLFAHWQREWLVLLVVGRVAGKANKKLADIVEET